MVSRLVVALLAVQIGPVTVSVSGKFEWGQAVESSLLNLTDMFGQFVDWFAANNEGELTFIAI